MTLHEEDDIEEEMADEDQDGGGADTEERLTSARLTADVDDKMDLFRAALESRDLVADDHLSTADATNARILKFIAIQNGHLKLVSSLQDTHEMLKMVCPYNSLWLYPYFLVLTQNIKRFYDWVFFQI